MSGALTAALPSFVSLDVGSPQRQMVTMNRIQQFLTTAHVIYACSLV